MLDGWPDRRRALVCHRRWRTTTFGGRIRFSGSHAPISPVRNTGQRSRRETPADQIPSRARRSHHPRELLRKRLFSIRFHVSAWNDALCLVGAPILETYACWWWVSSGALRSNPEAMRWAPDLGRSVRGCDTLAPPLIDGLYLRDRTVAMMEMRRTASDRALSVCICLWGPRYDPAQYA